MTTGSLLLGIALFLIVGLIIARPFLLPRARPPKLTERQALLAQKDALLAQIRALDFDAETGKQLPQEYEAERELLLQQATAVLARLEETTDSDAAIEAAVARLRTAVPVPKFCSQCGTAVSVADRFCTNCGHSLAKPMAPTEAGS